MNWRTTATLGTVFVALVILRAVTKPPESQQGPAERLFAWTNEEYLKIEIQPLGLTEIILERRPPVAGVVWFITKPLDRPAWDPHVQDMMSALRALTSAGAVRPDAEGYDPAGAGLDKPELVVHVHRRGEKKTVKFGRKVPQDPALRWFSVEGDPSIYMGHAEASEPFARGVADIRHRGVVFFDRHLVVRVEVHERFERAGPGGAVQRVLQASEFMLQDNPSGQRLWYWTKRDGDPLRERLNEERVTALLAELGALTAEDFAEVGDPAAHGLDAPDLKYALWSRDGDRPLAVRVGKAEKWQGRDVRFVQVEGSTEAAIVLEERLHGIPRRRDAFRSLDVYDFQRDEVAWVELSSDLGRVRLSRRSIEGQAEEEWAVVEPKPTEFQADPDELREFLKLLLGLRIKDETGFLGPQPDLRLFGLQPPMLTLTYHLRRRNGAEEDQVFKFGFKGSGDAYLMKPGLDDVFAVPDVVFRRLDRLELNFRDRVVFSVPVDKIQQVSATFQRDGGAKPMYFWVGRQPNGTWKFLDSENRGEPDPDRLRQVLQLVNYIKAERYVSRRAEAAREYGLDRNDPRAKLEVFYDGGRAVLKISAPVGGNGAAEGVRYGQFVGQDAVFQLPAKLVDTLKAGVARP